MRTSILSLMLLAGTAFAAPAGAHVVLEEDQATTGANFTAQFNVMHGCDGAPTTALTVQIPPGITKVKPEAKAGWTVSAGKGAQPGSQAVTFRGTLAASEPSAFSIAMRLPKRQQIVVFPSQQACGSTVVNWSEIGDATTEEAALKRPAPVLNVAAPLPAGKTPAVTAIVSDGWIRALPAGVPAGGYFTLHNDGNLMLHLTGARSPACASIELHKEETANNGGTNGMAGMNMPGMGGMGMMQMKAMNKIGVAPGGKLTFAPGGYHLMCLTPSPAIKPGASVPVTLEFENGGTLTTTFLVKPGNAN